MLGAGSVAVALFEPQRQGLQAGFIVSSVGITAIVLGVYAVKSARWGSRATRVVGRSATVLGAVGSALMAYALVGTMLSGLGVHLPALSLPLGEPDPVSAAATLATTAPAPATSRSTTPVDGGAAAASPPSVGTEGGVPAESALPQAGSENAPATAGAERSTLVQRAGALSIAMERAYGAGPYPSSLVVERIVPERLSTPDGSGLTTVPTGTRVRYSVSPDASAWSVTLVGGRFGTVATYDSAAGTVEAR